MAGGGGKQGTKEEPPRQCEEGEGKMSKDVDVMLTFVQSGTRPAYAGGLSWSVYTFLEGDPRNLYSGRLWGEGPRGWEWGRRGGGRSCNLLLFGIFCILHHGFGLPAQTLSMISDRIRERERERQRKSEIKEQGREGGRKGESFLLFHPVAPTFCRCLWSSGKAV